MNGLLLFLLLAQGRLERVGFRCGRALRRRWPTWGARVLARGRFRRLDQVVRLLYRRILVVVEVRGGASVLQLLRLLRSDCGLLLLLLLLQHARMRRRLLLDVVDEMGLLLLRLGG